MPKLWPDYVIVNNGRIREMVDFYPTHFDNASQYYAMATNNGAGYTVIWANGDKKKVDSIPAEFSPL